MLTVGMRELRSRLSEYVRLAAAGERVLVMDRDRVVAELTAPRQEPAVAVADPILEDLIERGIATRPTKSGEAPLLVRRTMKLEELLADLDADRADR
jgi:antitoxin (DNA-binding transcriptional repressor) of toxin-antitoxin stability system